MTAPHAHGVAFLTSIGSDHPDRAWMVAAFMGGDRQFCGLELQNTLSRILTAALMSQSRPPGGAGPCPTLERTIPASHSQWEHSLAVTWSPALNLRNSAHYNCFELCGTTWNVTNRTSSDQPLAAAWCRNPAPISIPVYEIELASSGCPDFPSSLRMLNKCRDRFSANV